MAKIEKVLVNGLAVGTKGKNGNVYISLTDIARLKNDKEPRFIVYSWLKSKATVSYLGLWEVLNNPDFNRYEFDTVKNEAGDNAFSLTPKEWKDKMNGIGLMSVAGKYDSGIFAHEDIAMEFASWVSAEFKLYLVQEFKRLKQKEQAQLEWDAKRELSKINYRLHTDAIKENLIVPELTQAEIRGKYASEADMLNVALFGKRATAWQLENKDKKGNMRDYASIEELLVLINLESYNAVLIEEGKPQSERIQLLNKTARKQLEAMLGMQIDKPKVLGLTEYKGEETD